MPNFPALVCPGLANSPRKGPSLALFVMLIMNNHSTETGVSTARGAVIALLRHPSVCHRCFTDLVLFGGVWECTGSRDAPGVSVQVPALCLGRQELTSASSHTQGGQGKVEQGNQVTAERGCSFAICRRVCGSLTCWVNGRCPRHWEYWKVLSLLGCERQGELCWQMMSPVRSRLHPATAANQRWLCAAQILYC